VLQYVAMCCSMMRCMLQYNTRRAPAIYYITQERQCVAICHNVLHRVAVCVAVCVAVHVAVKRVLRAHDLLHNSGAAESCSML